MTVETVRYSWTQAICEADWIKQEGTWVDAPELGEDAQVLTEVRRPVRLITPDDETPTVERCAWCGEPTIVGIFKRADPTTVPYPRLKEDD